MIKTFSYQEIVERIITINRAWKSAQEVRHNETTKKSVKSIVRRLQLQKSSWQVTLIRSFPEKIYIKIDNDKEYAEELLSIRLLTPIKLNTGEFKGDAEHLPLRIATDLFTSDELMVLQSNYSFLIKSSI
jgi:hypothetical protein